MAETFVMIYCESFGWNRVNYIYIIVAVKVCNLELDYNKFI